MMLSDLTPRWVGAGGAGITRNGKPVPQRRGVGMTFDCPCGCGNRRYVGFENPVDGGLPREERPLWRREGASFDNLTLSPSVWSHPDKGGCGWHGWIRNGEAVSV